MKKNDAVLRRLRSMILADGLENGLYETLLGCIYLVACKSNEILDSSGTMKEYACKLISKMTTETRHAVDNCLLKLAADDIKELVCLILGNLGDKFAETVDVSMCELVYDLLEINNGCDTIFDLYLGNGSFLANVIRLADKSRFDLRYSGFGTSKDLLDIVKIAFSIIAGDESKIELFEGSTLQEYSVAYNRGFAFPMFDKRLLDAIPIRSLLFPDISFSNRNSPEWVYIDFLLNSLSGERGRAVSIVLQRALFNSADYAFRNRLIESGWLEGIIELPSGALGFSSVKAVLLVFSRGNKAVRLVDASNVFGNRATKMNRSVQVPVREIESLYYSENTKKKFLFELVKMLNITPSAALLDVKAFKDSIELGEMAEIIIGKQSTVSEFERKGILTDKDTGCKILTSADIEEGAIKWGGLRSIVCKNDKYDKFAIQKGDLVMSSKSSKIKIATVDETPKCRTIITGGMFLIRPRALRLNPVYLKMFFASKAGQQALKSIQKGSVIISMSAEDLRRLSIPFVGIEEQNAIAERYGSKLSELLEYKEKCKNRIMEMEIELDRMANAEIDGRQSIDDNVVLVG